MNGLELSKRFFEEYGMPMLEKDFPNLLPYLAAGFVGSGSDRYGYDDEVSRDHDFEPGFCIFLPDEDTVSRRDEFLLERAYAKLPKEFGGVERLRMPPVGGNRNGVMRTADFYRSAAGTGDGILTVSEWMCIPDYALAESVNGKVYFDNLGEFNRIRSLLINMPRDIRCKRIAGNLLLMAQSGQYNYERCLSHGEYEAAQLACTEFVQSAMKVLFHLRDRYMPYYKWSFRALREADGGEEYAQLLSELLYGDNREDAVKTRKVQIIEDVSIKVISELRSKGLTKQSGDDLERHAYSVNDSITDGEIRNMNILAGI